ncbi:pilus assembly protein N-terminal domain-containing protein [Comamonas sp. JC664]|uniref:pilus assembly protein N-terminal domain-containing protein n=1 Tax=Comamonas sp. JC664 TaxID=2801917 RepID=UPI00174806DA|nr:pilus assembly protein N-terminal domain-containing protein [Comamonas sp. JC664]MBL0697686.1 pilus assembly protein N-terminal domain-containing protein [Comamonas sp. JC664]GHG69015.1 hypothetical protein GCM10012319_12780 [Comamonas sp. KCTC 72670]
MALLTDFSPFLPRRSRWAPLALTLAASIAWAQPAPASESTTAPAPSAASTVDYAAEAKAAEPSGIVVRVPPGQQTQFILENVERVLVQQPGLVEASVGEPNQVMVQGLELGVSEVLVWREGIKRPLSVRVEVGQ